jgi:hypothetical protein
MAGSAATMASYGQVEFTTARGVRVTGKPLEVPAAIELLRMLGQVQETGSVIAQADLLAAFVKAAEITAAAEPPTVGELVNEVLPRFLFAQGAETPSPTGAGTPSSTSGGMT